MNRLIVLILMSLFLGGCAVEYYGPIAVPAEYTVERVLLQDQERNEERLKELQNPAPSPYRICPQDRFNITVYEYSEFDVKETVVTPDGALSLPLIGSVSVGGLTVQDAEKKIAEALQVYVKEPKVALLPLEVSGFSFTILGQVNKPGRYVVAVGRTRLSDAIAVAGGFVQGLYQGNTLPLADLSQAYISRHGEILPVNFEKAIFSGDHMNNIPLQNGDYIYIPALTGSMVSLLGEVRTQMYVRYTDGLSLLTALTYCHGLQDSHSKWVKVIRGGLKNPKVYTVNIDKMLVGKIQDFKLAPNDIIYFPKDGLSDWNVMIRKVLPTLQGLSMLAGPFGNPSDLYLVE